MSNALLNVEDLAVEFDTFGNLGNADPDGNHIAVMVNGSVATKLPSR